MTRSTLLALLVLAACKKPLADPPMAPEPMPEPAKPAPAPAPPAVQEIVRNFERVNFPYDSAELTSSTQQALRENAALLSANVDVVVEIQGHCDERGTTEYNLALGQKRASAVKKFLVANGVSPSRLTVVSYGEERPLDAGDGEIAWAQNRRAEFRIVSGAAGRVAGSVM